MVSKASEDLPDPETPVTTVRVLCGISKSMFLRLWTRAPRTTILSVDMPEAAALASRQSAPHLVRSGGLLNLSIINRPGGALNYRFEGRAFRCASSDQAECGLSR